MHGRKATSSADYNSREMRTHQRERLTWAWQRRVSQLPLNVELLTHKTRMAIELPNRRSVVLYFWRGVAAIDTGATPGFWGANRCYHYGFDYHSGFCARDFHLI